MNSASSLQKTLDEYKMISDVQLISDDNANDDDSLCGSFYSGECRKTVYCLIILIECFSNIHSTFFLLSYLWLSAWITIDSRFQIVRIIPLNIQNFSNLKQNKNNYHLIMKIT